MNERRKQLSYLSFTDMMLCAVGCALMLFIASALRAKGGEGGWDDRPLILVGTASADAQLGDFKCHWSLAAPFGSTGRDDVYNATPADGLTTGGQDALFLAPEAPFGVYTLSARCSARLNDADLMRNLVYSLPAAADRDTWVELYLSQYSRALRALRSGGALSDPSLIDDLSASLNSRAIVNTGGGTGKEDKEVSAYMRLRRGVLLHQLRVEKGVPSVLSGTLPASMETLRVGELAALSSSDLGALPAFLDLSQQLAGLPPSPKRALSAANLKWRDEFFRWRIVLDHGGHVSSLPIVNYQAHLEVASKSLAFDPLASLLFEELRILLSEQPGVVIRLRVLWGSEGAYTGSDRRSAVDTFSLRVPVTMLDRDVTVARIVLERGARTCRVLLSDKVD